MSFYFIKTSSNDKNSELDSSILCQSYFMISILFYLFENYIYLFTCLGCVCANMPQCMGYMELEGSEHSMLGSVLSSSM